MSGLVEVNDTEVIDIFSGGGNPVMAVIENSRPRTISGVKTAVRIENQAL